MLTLQRTPPLSLLVGRVRIKNRNVVEDEDETCEPRNCEDEAGEPRNCEDEDEIKKYIIDELESQIHTWLTQIESIFEGTKSKI